MVDKERPKDQNVICGMVETQCTDENPYDHEDLTSRMKRTLYYDPIKKPDRDTLSYSVTESAVAHFRNVAPMPMGKLGHRYASRLARDACISPCALLLGLIYIERLKNKNPKYLENISSSDLFLVSMMVSSKYLFDEGCEDEVFNDEWAISGDMTVSKVNALEREFLQAMEWRLYVHPHEFSSMLITAERDIALTNGGKRGWMTYSDLLTLLDSRKLYDQLAQAAGIMSAATCFCMVMYSSLVCFTALTSMALVSVSTSARPGQPYGPQPLEHDMGLEKNQSDPGSVVEAVDLHSGLVFAAGTTSLAQRRTRIHITDSMTVMQVDPDPVNHAMLAFQHETTRDLVHRVYESHYAEHPAVPKYRRKGSFCSMFEAFWLVAHIPTMCLTDYKKPLDHCTSCGKLEPGSDEDNHDYRLPPTEAMHVRSCSIHSDPLHSLELPIDLLPSSFGNKSSLFGIYNPTLPPIRNRYGVVAKYTSTVTAH